MGYIYNKKANTFTITSSLKLGLYNQNTIASNKTSYMLTLDNGTVTLTSDARNLKIKFSDNSSGLNDIKPDTEYTLSDFMALVYTRFNNSYTKNEVNNLVSAGTTGLDWKQSVNSYNDIANSYPNPQDGWTVNVKDTDITYRYDGSKWIAISANAIPNATSSVDGKMSSTDKAKLDGIASGANKYTHPSYTARTSGLYKITVDSTGHVSGVASVTKDDITNLGISAEGKNYSNFTGATASDNGSSGLVPAPSMGDSNRFLCSNGTWTTVTIPSYNVATTTTNGLMSSTDKAKLDGIASGATKITIDSSISTSSTNPVQNKVIADALNKRASVNHTHTKSDITDFSHTHTIADITNMSSASVSYATTAGSANSVSWSNVTDKPSFPSNLSNGSGTYSLIQSSGTSANGTISKALGVGVIADGYAQTVIGRYNIANGSNGTLTLDDYAFIIGGGTSTARANAFSVTWRGNTIINGCYGTSGADYAEYFEWYDGNPDNEDRIGRFVTLKGDKIVYATNGTDYIVGITSCNPSVLGDSCDGEWKNKFKKDYFGRKLTTKVEDENGNLTETFVLNKEFDDNIEYIPRSERKEWIPVGMLGKIAVYDDGTCSENKFCTVTSNGVATSLDSYSYSNGNVAKFYVLKRLSSNVILVLFK